MSFTVVLSQASLIQISPGNSRRKLKENLKEKLKICDEMPTPLREQRTEVFKNEASVTSMTYKVNLEFRVV